MAITTPLTDSAPAPAPSDAPTELPLDQALSLAMRLHRERQYDGAEQLYRRILDAAPDLADARHFLGVLCHQTGRSDEGVNHLRQAVAQVPGFAGFHMNLGNVHVERGELAQAAQCYARAAELDPGNADLLNNLGALSKAQDRFDDAERCYRKAIELAPEHINAHNNLGLLFAAQGRFEEAVRYYLASIALMPNHPDGHRLLGMTYYSMGMIPEAAEVFRQWLEKEPGQPMARHMYAACSGIGVPDRAADDYVEQLFDRFAGDFEMQLTERLAYKAPRLCADALAAHLTPDGTLDVLDAGCGTGLCGPMLAPYARALTGVDLSGGMLDKARTKGSYSALVKAELGGYLAGTPAAWDVILSADTLCYFGDLHGVLAAAASALRTGGWLVFTVEDPGEPAPSEGFRINPHGRYSHAGQHVRMALGAAGLTVVDIRPDTLRTEGGNPVAGLVCVAHKP